MVFINWKRFEKLNFPANGIRFAALLVFYLFESRKNFERAEKKTEKIKFFSLKNLNRPMWMIIIQYG
jgi:hypothetical protein